MGKREGIHRGAQGLRDERQALTRTSVLSKLPTPFHTYPHLSPCSQQRLQRPRAQQQPHHPQPARDDRGWAQCNGRCCRCRCRHRRRGSRGLGGSSGRVVAGGGGGGGRGGGGGLLLLLRQGMRSDALLEDLVEVGQAGAGLKVWTISVVG